MGHIVAALLLAIVGGVITYALGYDGLVPLIVGVLVFLAYFGVVMFIIDADWD
jgi:membrane protein YdbS with pleckstrin-like domain